MSPSPAAPTPGPDKPSVPLACGLWSLAVPPTHTGLASGPTAAWPGPALPPIYAPHSVRLSSGCREGGLPTPPLQAPAGAPPRPEAGNTSLPQCLAGLTFLPSLGPTSPPTPAGAWPSVPLVAEAQGRSLGLVDLRPCRPQPLALPAPWDPRLPPLPHCPGWASVAAQPWGQCKMETGPLVPKLRSVVTFSYRKEGPGAQGPM